MSPPEDTQFRDTIICPWCGYAVPEGDLFEFRDGLDDCLECGKHMQITIHIPDPTYTTEKVPVTPPGHQPGCSIAVGSECSCQQREKER